MLYILEASNLSKMYNGNCVINQVSCSFKEGSFVAILGKNGAGKTTLLKLFAGLIKPTQGDIYVLDCHIDEIKKVSKFIGMVHQYSGLPDLLTVREFFELEMIIRHNFDIENLQKSIRLVGLEQYYDQRIINLSEGNRRKIVIMKSIFSQPKLLMLDEPTNALDPKVKKDIWNCLQNLKNFHTTVIISTNDLEEMRYLCDYIIVLNHGSIVLNEKIENLSDKNFSDLYI